MNSLEDREALELLDFWLGQGMARWFGKSDEFDAECQAHIALWERARDGACDHWAATAAGALALVILLDQIPRNAFRGQAAQFSTDGKALQVAEAAIAAGFDRSQPMPSRMFFYMPFEHSEDLAVQERSLDLMRPLGDQDTYYWALVHYDAIRRFGRFPHRNGMLGRETTAAEQAYLDTGGFGH